MRITTEEVRPEKMHTGSLRGETQTRLELQLDARPCWLFQAIHGSNLMGAE